MTAADDGIGVDLIHDFPSTDATIVGAPILDASQLESTNHQIRAPVFGHDPVFVQEEPFRRYLGLSIFYQPGVFGNVMVHVKPFSDAESPKLSPNAIAHRFCAIFDHYKTAERNSSFDHVVQMHVQFVLGGQQASEWNAVVLRIAHENRKSFWSWPVLRAVGIERIDSFPMEGLQQLVSREHAGRVVEAPQSGRPETAVHIGCQARLPGVQPLDIRENEGAPSDLRDLEKLVVGPHPDRRRRNPHGLLNKSLEGIFMPAGSDEKEHYAPQPLVRRILPLRRGWAEVNLSISDGGRVHESQIAIDPQAVDRGKADRLRYLQVEDPGCAAR